MPKELDRTGNRAGGRRASALLLALAGLLPAARPAREAKRPSEPVILGPGRYYERDVPDLGGDWWALSKGARGWEIRPATLDVEPIALEGDSKGRRSGLEIRVKGDEAALLFRNVPGMAAFRKVPEASEQRSQGEAPEAQRAEGRVGSEPYVVWSEPVSTGRSAGFVVKVESRGQEQVLLVHPGCEGCAWELLWAGDLDGDGRLDLLLGTTDEGSRGALRLFLSGAAGPGQVLRQVAAQRWEFGD